MPILSHCVAPHSATRAPVLTHCFGLLLYTAPRVHHLSNSDANINTSKNQSLLLGAGIRPRARKLQGLLATRAQPAVSSHLSRLAGLQRAQLRWHRFQPESLPGHGKVCMPLPATPGQHELTPQSTLLSGHTPCGRLFGVGAGPGAGAGVGAGVGGAGVGVGTVSSPTVQAPWPPSRAPLNPMKVRSC